VRKKAKKRKKKVTVEDLAEDLAKQFESLLKKMDQDGEEKKMGTCRDEIGVEPKDPDKKKPRRLWRKKKEDPKEKLSELINKAAERLETLEQVKTGDLDKEDDNEVYNRQALAKIQEMQYHVDRVIDVMEDY